MSDTQNSRSKYEATLDIRYGMRLHFLHSRMYRHFRAGVAIISLLGGSAALVSALQALPHGILFAGIVVAATSCADIVCGWAEKAARHDVLRRRLADLLARAPGLTLEAIDSELARYEADADDEIESLRLPAYNDNVRSNGHEDWARPEPLATRLIRLVS
jgi:hypothetical protein